MAMFPLALARSLIALSTLITILFNPSDIVFGNSPQTLPLYNFYYWASYLGSHGPEIMACIVLVFAVSGFFPRIFAIPHWWLCWSLIQSVGASDGGDLFNQIVTLFFIPICFKIFDPICHFRRSADINLSSRKFSLSFLLMLQVQVSVIYFFAAIDKMNHAEWLDGSANYYLLLHNEFGASGWVRDLIESILKSIEVVRISTYLVIAAEVLIGTALFWPSRWKRFLFVPAVSFHVILALVFGIWTLSLSVIACLIIYLLVRIPTAPQIANYQ